MNTISEKTIDIDSILEAKAGKKARFIPGFVRRWLKQIIHQDEINVFLWEARDKEGVEWLEAVLKFLDVTVEVKGEENFPAAIEGKHYTFVSNHPLGGADGVALGAVIGRHYEGKVKYLVNDLLMNLPNLAPLCIPINKTGAQGRQFPAMVEAGFKSDNHIIMFPAGLCSRKSKGVIRDIPWKKTFVVKSRQTQRDVVPIHFSGANSNRFYRIANITKRLGIKFNIAMLFLVDEMFRNRHKTFTITIGKPIEHTTFDNTRTPAQWAQWVEDNVYRLNS